MSENELLEVKLRLKKWEAEFVSKYERKPTKNDISESPQEVRDLYKKYWKLKSPNQSLDTWGNHLNKKRTDVKVESKHNSTSDRFVMKIKNFVGHKNIDSKVKNIDDKNLNSDFNDTIEKSDLNVKNIDKKNLSTDFNKPVENSDLNTLRNGLKFVVKRKEDCRNTQLINAVTSTAGNCKLSRRLSIDHGWLNRCDNSIICEADLSYKAETHKKREDVVMSNASFNSETPNEIYINNTEQISPVKLQKSNSFEEFLDLKSDCQNQFETNDNEKSVDNISENNIQLENSSLNADIDTKTISLKSTKRPILDNDFECHVNKVKKMEKKTEKFVDVKLSDKSEHKRKILEKKLKSGTANDNFVRIDIKKKKFHRGKTKFSMVKYKRKQWAQRHKNRDSNSKQSSSACFNCGETGHWVVNCPRKKSEFSNDTLSDQVCDEINDSPFLTLDEAAALAVGIKPDKTSNNFERKSSEIEDLNDNETNNSFDVCKETDTPNDHNVQDFEYSNSCLVPILTEPVFNLNEDGNVIETPLNVLKALNKFGYAQFRPGQEQVVMRILSGLSTLLILSTGAGKSLCYQLPAYLYSKKTRCITLVISPLVSLMEDQVTGLPACLRAVCIHSNLTSVQKEKACSAVNSGNVHILLVSPEMVVNVNGFLNLFRSLPPIAFACIDEAHCVSEWSHNFRPSYLRLYKVLRHNLGVKCILALTATATVETAKSIAKNLSIADSTSAVIRGTLLRSNLFLSVSRDDDRDQALLNLLKGKRFSDCQSIIIYCTRRQETERLATLIRTCLQVESQSKSSNCKLAWNAEAYHAGLTAAKRRSVQKHFMSGKLRIVVATVAFGMGLDKSDVHGVIHYNMPRRFESYIQEIGRAGRDGKPSHCHLFLDLQGDDLCELRRHIYCNSVDRSTLRKLLRNVFVPCKCNKIHQASNEAVICRVHEVALPINQIVEELDLKEENISTLLCYLELSPKKWIEILSPVYSTCKIQCYVGSAQLKKIAKESPPLAAAVALAIRKGQNFDKTNEIEFPVVEVASQMGWESNIVKRELKALEWSSESGRLRKTGVIVEFSDLALHFRAPGNLNNEQLDEVLDYLHNQVSFREKMELMQLNTAYKAFYRSSKIHYWSCSDEIDENKNEKLKNYLKAYFDDKLAIEDDEDDCLYKENYEKKEDLIRNDIRNFISIHHDEKFTGRSIARIFSGIDSPRHPAVVWSRVRRFWRSHLDVDFNYLCKWATQEIAGLTKF